jgi:cytochrome c heme-lyase
MGASASKDSLSNSQQVIDSSREAASIEQQQDAAAAQSRCPVPEGYRNPAIYNVYSQRINDPAAQQSCPSPLSALQGTDLLDPKNNMPLEANQQPCPGQRKPLSTERVQSTIPKGGTDSTWLYPSPQMFFNGGCMACTAGTHPWMH